MNFRRAFTLSLSRILAASALILPLASAFPSAAQTAATPPKDARIGALVQSIGQTRPFRQAAISPDGKTVAWSLETRDGTQIHLADLSNPAKETVILTEAEATDCSNTNPIWSPDGQWLAFQSTCSAKEDTPDQEEIFLWSKKTGQSRQLTHVTGEIDSPAWSPDGRSIGFLFVENATRSAGALAAMKPWSGVIGEDGVEVQRVAVANVASGSLSQVTPANLHVYEFDWSPDSKQTCLCGSESSGREQLVGGAALYTDRATGGNPVGTGPHIQPKVDSRYHPNLRPSAQSPDRPPPLVARRQTDRLHRRPDERPGIDRRRHLPHPRRRWRAARCNPRTSGIRGLHPLDLARGHRPQRTRRRKHPYHHAEPHL